MVFLMESPTEGIRRWFHRRFHRWKCHVTIWLSQFESLGHSVGKIVWCHHAVAYFQTNNMPRRRNNRYTQTKIVCQYIPTVSLTDLGRRYIPTDFETGLCPSVNITDGMFPSVIPLVLSSFLVVTVPLHMSVMTIKIFILPTKSLTDYELQRADT
jgi:hypothetical protein